MRILILYDNVAHPPLRGGWGFSGLVEAGERRILFDTGADRLLLAHNARVLGVDLAQVTDVFLSHAHCDHVGGLSYVLERAEGVRVWAPKGMARYLRPRTPDAELRIVDGPCELGTGLVSTGTLGRSVREQGLIVLTSHGMVLVTGCAHPGVERMAERAFELTGASLHLVLGGFHLGGAPSHQIRRVVAQLGQIAHRVGPGHCTGEEATGALLVRFPGSEALAVGKEVRVSESRGGDR
ncbi:MBL fold metallo-hydrolase [Candidatus Bipolaricaulota bacterium]|nr:MBL fold metallo-hydrolase [Candidatus Bipolaricaulota bacterium]